MLAWCRTGSDDERRRGVRVGEPGHPVEPLEDAAPLRRRKPSKGAEAYALRRAAQAALAAQSKDVDEDAADEM